MNIFYSLQSSTYFETWSMNLYCDPKYCIRKLVKTTQPLRQWFLDDSFLGGQVNKNISNVSSSFCWINSALDQKLKLWPLFSYLVFFQQK